MKRLLLLLLTFMVGGALYAQAPKGFNYQAVVRNSAGELLKNRNISVRITIRQGSAEGTVAYQEVYNARTNANGLVSIVVGATSQQYDTLDWANGPYFLISEMDPENGANYTLNTTQQIFSVPYAEYARVADHVSSTFTYDETDPKFQSWGYQYDSLVGAPTTIEWDSVANKPTTLPWTMITGAPTTILWDSVVGAPTTILWSNIVGAPTTIAWDSVTGVPTTIAWDSVTGVPTTIAWDSVTGVPTTIAWDSVTGKPTTIEWDSVTNKPTTIVWDSVTGKPTTVEWDSVVGVPTTIAWDSVTGKPTTIVWDSVTGKPTTIEWDSVINKPDTLPWTMITGAPTTIAWDSVVGVPTTIVWDSVTGKPTTILWDSVVGHRDSLSLFVNDVPLTLVGDSLYFGTQSVYVGSLVTRSLPWNSIIGRPTTIDWDSVTRKPVTLPWTMITDAPTTIEWDSVVGVPTTIAWDSVTGKPTTIEWDSVTNKPTTIEWDSVTGKPTTVEWDSVINKPTTIEWDSVTGKPTTIVWDSVTGKPTTVEWDSVINKPATLPWTMITGAPTTIEWDSVTGVPTTITWDSVMNKPTTMEWDSITNKPTTIEWDSVTNKPTTIAWNKVTGSPTTLSYFTNDLGLVLGANDTLYVGDSSQRVDLNPLRYTTWDKISFRPTRLSDFLNDMPFTLYHDTLFYGNLVDSQYVDLSPLRTGSIPWTSVTGRPTRLSQFFNDLHLGANLSNDTLFIPATNDTVDLTSLRTTTLPWTSITGRPSKLSQFQYDLRTHKNNDTIFIGDSVIYLHRSTLYTHWDSVVARPAWVDTLHYQGTTHAQLRIHNLVNPTYSTDAANKAYVDARNAIQDLRADSLQDVIDSLEEVILAIQHPTIEGMLPGLFSVSASKQVVFSQGNLQYHPSMDLFRFADHQYDFLGVQNNYADDESTGTRWLDLFGYGTSTWSGGRGRFMPWDTRTNDDQYMVDRTTGNDLTGVYANCDWGRYNTIINGGNQHSQWRTLTKDEWDYLLNQRPNYINLKTLATVGGIRGLIILPDSWMAPAGIVIIPNMTLSGDNVFSLSQWADMETAGAVFLPVAGYRVMSTTTVDNINGFYWSSSHVNTTQSTTLQIRTDTGTSLPATPCSRACSVRLVRDY